jgi:exodeoxyribonuclease-1
MNGITLAETILWHDYETWGVNPSVDFPVQFAAIRTDLDLNILESHPPINWMCAIPHDYLPHPQACLITGLTPLLSLQKGMSEPNFTYKIHQQLAAPETCTAGYNSIKFDEEVTRHLLYRNFYPVYEREYNNGNSRWDIIDLVRACYALRPDNIHWPKHDNDKPSFRLEDLTKANEISHQSAHDALSDVHATIEIAKLIKQKQPKLYDFYWQLRDKHQVAKYLHRFLSDVFVYVSAYIDSEQGCCSLILPICPHPSNKNAVLCIDLLKPIELFTQQQTIEAKSETIKAELFSPNSELTKPRPGLLSIAINKCPFVAPHKTLTSQNANRLNIDVALALQNAQNLSKQSDIVAVCQQVYSTQIQNTPKPNVDQRLYTIGFPEPADISVMNKVRQSVAEQLVGFQGSFINEQYNELLFRYRARNYPHLLEDSEIQKWQQHLEARFTQTNKVECLALNEYFSIIDELYTEHSNNPSNLQILRSLSKYGEQMYGR